MIMSSPPASYSDNTRREIIQDILKLIQVLLISLLDLILSTTPICRDPQKYHTSILSRYAWVLELISGHPDRIYCELALRKEEFILLMAEFRSLGHHDTHRVTLEEQVAIFLYMCVTGLMVRYVAKHFQHSNDMISQ